MNEIKKTNTQKIGLVLEGGSMRGMFTAGVLDIFLDENIPIDGIIGVSAGALFGPNYFSKQRGRVIRYNKRFCKDKRYMSLFSLLLTKNMVNKQFAFYDVTYKYDLFDNDTFIQNNTGYYVTVTNVETGEPEYLEMPAIAENSNGLEILRASSALPFFSELIEINGKKYLDGGISDSIPVLKCKEMGYDKIIVILTRPLEYRKKPLSSSTLKLTKLFYRNYPNFIKAMETRYKRYNETINTISDLESNGEIFVIRPSEPITLKTIERNPDELQKVYELGIRDCQKQIGALKQYLQLQISSQVLAASP